MPPAERLALGTVQFGQDYGVANQTGQVDLDEASQILEIARAGGVDTLDTAIGYGESEARLGEIGVSDWQIVSKLPPLPADVADVAAWVADSVRGSLQRLGVERLHGLLLHRPLEMDGDLLAGLIAIRDQGLTRRIGISVYGPDELEAVWVAELDLVQAPFNVFDRRLITSGWLERLVEAGVEVHVRSAFLQGLLLMEQRPAYFDRWSGLLTAWEGWLQTHSMTPLAACVGFALAQPGIDRVVVGVDSAQQLEQVLAAVDVVIPPVPDTLASDDSDLINPSHWDL